MSPNTPVLGSSGGDQTPGPGVPKRALLEYFAPRSAEKGVESLVLDTSGVGIQTPKTPPPSPSDVGWYPGHSLGPFTRVYLGLGGIQGCGIWGPSPPDVGSPGRCSVGYPRGAKSALFCACLNAKKGPFGGGNTPFGGLWGHFWRGTGRGHEPLYPCILRVRGPDLSGGHPEQRAQMTPF